MPIGSSGTVASNGLMRRVAVTSGRKLRATTKALAQSLTLIALAAVGPAGALAQTAPAPSQSRSLEEKILLLEKRIQELEAQQQRAPAARATAAPRPAASPAATSPPSQPPVPTGGSVAQAPPQPGSVLVPRPGTPLALPPPSGGPDAVPALMDRAMVEQVVSAAVAQAKAEAKVEAKAEMAARTKVADPAKDPTLAAAFLYADTLPTLNTNSYEVGLGFNYTRSNSGAFSDRIFTGLASFRYSFAEGWEVAARVPYIANERAVVQQVFDAGISFDEGIATNSYFGDTTVTGSHVLVRPKDWYPGLAVSLGAVIPTGEKPYKFAPSYGAIPSADGTIVEPKYAQDPRDPFTGINSRGHWAAGGQATLFRTFDPVVLFLGVGIEYAFPESVSAFSNVTNDRVTYQVAPGMRYLASLGASVAFNEFTTLGVQVGWSYEEAWKIDGKPLLGRGVEGASARFLLNQRLDKDLYLEPSVTLGLTDTVPDFGAGMNVRRRF